MSMRRTPTPSLTRRICKAVAQGVPVEIAARQQGIALDTLALWMERGQKGRGKYRDFAAAVDKAEAQAVADYTVMIRKAANRGKASAAFRWLSSRAPQFFAAASSRGGAASDGRRLNLAALLDLAKDIDNMSIERCAALDAMSDFPSVGLMQSLKSARDRQRQFVDPRYEQDTLGAEELPALPEPETPALPEGSFVPLTSVVEPGTLPVGDDPNIIEMAPIR